MKQKEVKGVFLVQREGRISIPRKKRDNLGIQEGSFVFGCFRKATNEEILKELKKYE